MRTLTLTLTLTRPSPKSTAQTWANVRGTKLARVATLIRQPLVGGGVHVRIDDYTRVCARVYLSYLFRVHYILFRVHKNIVRACMCVCVREFVLCVCVCVCVRPCRTESLLGVLDHRSHFPPYTHAMRPL